MKDHKAKSRTDNSASVFAIFMVWGAPLCILLMMGGFLFYSYNGGAIDQSESLAIFGDYYLLIAGAGYIILAPQAALTAALIIHCIKEKGFVTYWETLVAATLSISLPMLLSGFMIWKWILAIGAVWIVTSLFLRLLWTSRMGRGNAFA